MMGYQIIAEVMFYAFIILTIFGAVLAVKARILMHCVLGLAVCLLGVAGLYFYLGSIFLTYMQILIYVGAVCIVLVFGVMVGYTPNETAEKVPAGRNLMAAVIASAVTAFLLIVAAVFKTDWTPATKISGDFSIEAIGVKLLHQYCLVFELISVVLLIAIVGSIIIAQGGREEK